MKKSVLFLIAVVGLASCVNDPNDPSTPGKDKENVFKPQFIMTEDYQVPITTGKITVVTMGEDTLAVTDVPMTIQIPKKSQGILKVSTVDPRFLPWYKEGSGVKNGNFMLVFEDSPTSLDKDGNPHGDADYNDLVLIVKQSINNGCKISYKPIALGSSKKIEFGYELVENGKIIPGTEVILHKDVRAELFNGKKGSINTFNHVPFVAPIATNNPANECGYKTADVIVPSSNLIINYFIKVDKVDNDPLSGKKFSIASVTENTNGTNGTLPFGLAIPAFNGFEGRNQPFIYPREGMSIFKAYDKFGDWVKGKNNADMWYRNSSPEDLMISNPEDRWIYIQLASIKGLFNFNN